MTVTVTGLTAPAMLAIKNAVLVDAFRNGDSLRFRRGDGTFIDLGPFVTKEEFDDQGPSGRELAYAESNAYTTGIAGSTIDIGGLSVTFTVLNRPVYVEADLPKVAANAAAGVVRIHLSESGGTSRRQAYQAFAASEIYPMRVVERFSVPGTYTRKVRVQSVSGTATYSVNENPADVKITASIRAVEA